MNQAASVMVAAVTAMRVAVPIPPATVGSGVWASVLARVVATGEVCCREGMG